MSTLRDGDEGAAHEAAAASRRGLTRRAVLVGAPVALVYFLAVGGTPAGEVIGVLRVVNSVLAAAFVVLYFMQAPTRNDAIDRLVLVAVLLFALASMTSAFPRQSLDAYLAMVTYAAILYVARDALRDDAMRGLIVWAMRAMCAFVVLVSASRLFPDVIAYWRVSGGLTPTIGIPLVARPWGNAYDLVTLAIMLFPSWLVRPMSRWRAVVSAVLGLLLAGVVLFLGARAIWLAVGVASLLLLAPSAYRVAIRRIHLAGPALIGVIAVTSVLIVVLGGGIASRLFAFATVGQRLAMWRAAVEAWAERPFTGLGPGSFPWILQSTDYFDTNSIHPRHPDSAFFQLLPEAGLVGVVAAALVIAAVAIPIIRRRRLLVLWPLTVFLVACIGANPTDFSYLVVVAILWAALGLPRRRTGETASPAAERRWTIGSTRVGLAVVAVVWVVVLFAGLRYDAAVREIGRGNLEAARAELDAAVSLDPAMAIYVRQRGVTSLLLGDLAASVRDLEHASHLNSNDDLTWRSLAIALKADERQPASATALDHAVDIQRSDPTNLLLLAAWDSQQRESGTPGPEIAEIVLAWPGVLAAPGWTDIAKLSDPTSAIGLALSNWEEGDPSPEPLRHQPLQLAAIGERDDLLDAATELTRQSPELAAAGVAVYRCEADADERLRDLSAQDRFTTAYWALRIQRSAETGTIDEDALEAYRILSGSNPTMDASERLMNPLWENNAQGSADAWGYDRVPVYWGNAPIYLPLPDAGATRWMLDPKGARLMAGFTNGPGDCPSP